MPELLLLFLTLFRGHHNQPHLAVMLGEGAARKSHPLPASLGTSQAPGCLQRPCVWLCICAPTPPVPHGSIHACIQLTFCTLGAGTNANINQLWSLSQISEAHL